MERKQNRHIQLPDRITKTWEKNLWKTVPLIDTSSCNSLMLLKVREKKKNMDGGNKDKWETIAVSSCRNVLQRECLWLHFLAATSLLPTTFCTNLIFRSSNLVPSRETYFWEIQFQHNWADKVLQHRHDSQLFTICTGESLDLLGMRSKKMKCFDWGKQLWS